MLVRAGLVLLLAVFPIATAEAQPSFVRRLAACRCEPAGKVRKPRFLLPVVGGIGILPVTIAARDSQLPSLGLPTLVDIRENYSPRTAIEGERALAMGALAPDTATSLPTLMLVAAALLLVGLYFVAPRRRGRLTWASWRSRSSRARGGWRLRTIHRRRAGFAIASCGGLLLVLGAREYAEGAEAQRRARSEWLQMGETVVRINEPEPAAVAPNARKEIGSPSLASVIPGSVAPSGAASAVPLPLLAISGREIRRGAPVARLVIESIGLDEIVTEGVGPVELNGGPGHFPGSVLPGQAGNSILSAHRDRHFSRVGELAIGSTLRTETRDGGAVEWVVTERRIVSKDTPALFEESDATLTLTTCWPIRYFGPAPDRLLIIAKRAG